MIAGVFAMSSCAKKADAPAEAPVDSTATHAETPATEAPAAPADSSAAAHSDSAAAGHDAHAEGGHDAAGHEAPKH